MNDLVILERDGDVGIIALNNPPVNALSPGVIDGLKAGFANYLKDRTIRAVVLMGMDRAFCGGADIKEFGKLAAGGTHAGDVLNPLFNSIEEAAKPVVAAIHGACLG